MATAVVSSSSAAAALFSVAGKNVLVTGGSRGIGKMICQGFAEAGANVLLTSRDEAACRAAALEISMSNSSLNSSSSNSSNNNHSTPTAPVEPLQCDYIVSNVSTRAGCEALAAQVAQIFNGQLHVLVNNAGTSWGEPMSRESSTKINWGFDKVFDLNVKGLFYLTRACRPLLAQTGTIDDPARIINVGSVAGLVPQDVPTHAYDASKAAVHSLTHKWAAELARECITVNALAPGYVPTRMSQGLESYGANAETMAKNTIPLQRMGRASDMAGACIYLCSPAGSWCTGLILHVDGGTIGAQTIPVMASL
jgi:NAD(P)-dependent dehydrogenase (short-subunit alcohol dehydrogenase family)